MKELNVKAEPGGFGFSDVLADRTVDSLIASVEYAGVGINTSK